MLIRKQTHNHIKAASPARTPRDLTYNGAGGEIQALTKVEISPANLLFIVSS